MKKDKGRKMLRKLILKIIEKKYTEKNDVYEKYDEKGNLIYLRDFHGNEEWYTNGKLTHYKTHNGYESWAEYNDFNKMTYYKNSKGKEEWFDYNEVGSLTHYRNSEGFEEWYNYNNDNTLACYKNNCRKGNKIKLLINDLMKKLSGKKTVDEAGVCKKYNDKGELIYYRDIDGNEEWYNKATLYHRKTNFGLEIWYEYDSKGRLYHVINNECFEQWYEYDEKDRQIHYRTSNNYEQYTEYDERGNISRTRSLDGSGGEWVYNYTGRLLYYKDPDGCIKIGEEYDKKFV